ncbi:BCL2/adenovirus E1B 19 kDa protein-interacting protein 3 [Hetaerina americana]|uniref:BCL2/adenovirus E1B 19 kDa protein-interacting protein 3 n=1 Tax=Hetaerina americana TaxID=62018 RepID=UPI003A7F4650
MIPHSKSPAEDVLGESWVDLTSSRGGTATPSGIGSAVTLTQQQLTHLPLSCSVSGEEYLRLLREAQRESNPSSAPLSLASSRRDTPGHSPKSPPNSPDTEAASEDDLGGVYVNYCGGGVERLAERGSAGAKDSEFIGTDWIWEWSSRPELIPPRDWKFKHPKKRTYSIRNAKFGKTSLFSKEVLYTLFISNVISILLGTGVGVWLSRRGCGYLPRTGLE